MEAVNGLIISKIGCWMKKEMEDRDLEEVLALLKSAGWSLLNIFVVLEKIGGKLKMQGKE